MTLRLAEEIGTFISQAKVYLICMLSVTPVYTMQPSFETRQFAVGRCIHLWKDNKSLKRHSPSTNSASVL